MPHFKLVCKTGKKYYVIEKVDGQPPPNTQLFICNYCTLDKIQKANNKNRITGAQLADAYDDECHKMEAIQLSALRALVLGGDDPLWLTLRNGLLEGYAPATRTFTTRAATKLQVLIGSTPLPGVHQDYLSQFSEEQRGRFVWAIMKISRRAWNRFVLPHTAAISANVDGILTKLQAPANTPVPASMQEVFNGLTKRYQHILFFRMLAQKIDTEVQIASNLPKKAQPDKMKPDLQSHTQLATDLGVARTPSQGAMWFDGAGLEFGRLQTDETSKGGNYDEIVDYLANLLTQCPHINVSLDSVGALITIRDRAVAIERFLEIVRPKLNEPGIVLANYQKLGETICTVSLLISALEPSRRLSTNVFYLVIFHFWRTGRVTTNQVLRKDGVYSIMAGDGTATKKDDAKHLIGKTSRRARVANVINLLMAETEQATKSIQHYLVYDLKDLAAAIKLWCEAASTKAFSTPDLTPSPSAKGELASLLLGDLKAVSDALENEFFKLLSKDT